MEKMNLYELTQSEQQIMDLMLASVDEETGEVDPQLAGLYNQIEMAKEDKIKGCVYAIKKMEDTYQLCKQEIDRIKKIMARCEKGSEMVRNLLANNIEVGKKYDFGTIGINWRNSTSVEIDNETEFCEKYKDNPAVVNTSISYKPNKTNIKTLLNEGVELDGCRVKTKANLQIK